MSKQKKQQDKEQILVCSECGSQNVQTMAWVEVNNNNTLSSYLGLEDVVRGFNKIFNMDIK